MAENYAPMSVAAALSPAELASEQAYETRPDNRAALEKAIAQAPNDQTRASPMQLAQTQAVHTQPAQSSFESSDVLDYLNSLPKAEPPAPTETKLPQVRPEQAQAAQSIYDSSDWLDFLNNLPQPGAPPEKMSSSGVRLGTLARLRKRFPLLANLDDNDAVDFIHHVYYPDFPRDQIASALGVEQLDASADGMRIIAERGSELLH